MLTIYTNVSIDAPDLILDGATDLPPGSRLSSAIATFGLDDHSTGLLARYYDKELGWVVAYLYDDEKYIAQFVSGPFAHDAFLAMCRTMLTACFFSKPDFATFITESHDMELT